LGQARAEAWSSYVHRDYGRFVVRMEAVRARAGTIKDLYNLACGYALTGQPDQALETLTEVVARGGTFDLLADPDLATLRGGPEFAAMVDRSVYARKVSEKLEPVRDRALAYYNDGQYEAFVEVMVTVAQLSNDDEDWYNLACGYALLGQTEDA